MRKQFTSFDFQCDFATGQLCGIHLKKAVTTHYERKTLTRQTSIRTAYDLLTMPNCYTLHSQSLSPYCAYFFFLWNICLVHTYACRRDNLYIRLRFVYTQASFVLYVAPSFNNNIDKNKSKRRRKASYLSKFWQVMLRNDATLFDIVIEWLAIESNNHAK